MKSAGKSRIVGTICKIINSSYMLNQIHDSSIFSANYIKQWQPLTFTTITRMWKKSGTGIAK